MSVTGANRYLRRGALLQATYMIEEKKKKQNFCFAAGQ